MARPFRPSPNSAASTSARPAPTRSSSAKRWLDAKDKLNLQTPFNMSTTHDIIGGNSGSPVIDREGRVVGAVFDGNIHSLGGDFGYDPVLNRSVTVVTPAIGEALRKIYGATRLIEEAEGM